MKDTLKQFFKDASAYQSIDPICFDLDEFSKNWIKDNEGVYGKPLVKNSCLDGVSNNEIEYIDDEIGVLSIKLTHDKDLHTYIEQRVTEREWKKALAFFTNL